MPVETQGETDMVSCEGSCHCGRVQILVNVPLEVKISSCNCSICKKSGYLHLTVNREDLVLLQGKDFLTEYRFNTGTARHLFCQVCGVKAFYVPRSHPHGYSVNLNCVKLDERIQLTIRNFDGQHWERNINGLLNRH